MFCTKCGKEIADGSAYCPLCGQQFTAAAPTQPKAPSNIGADIQSFFKDYFSNPVQAVSSRAKDSFWLWGLISFGAYILIHFFVSFFSQNGLNGYMKGYVAQYAFGTLFIDLLCFAALVFGIFLFASVFKLNKLSLPSTVALTGLAVLPLLPAYLIGLLFDKVIDGASLTNIFLTLVFLFAAILLYSQLREASHDVAGIRSIFVILIAVGCMLIIRNIGELIQYKAVVRHYSDYYNEYYNYLLK